MRADELSALADVYAFTGNSLLKPMTQTATVGIDPAFWRSFPDFDDTSVRAAVEECHAFAEEAQRRKTAGEDVVERVAVEYTKLFVGPPSPAAAPWETAYRSENPSVGFGEATFQMRDRLRAAGLQVSNDNNQFADHMGIELLLLAELTRRAAAAIGDADAVACDAARGAATTVHADGAATTAAAEAIDLLSTHPLSWVGAFRAKVAEAFPQGYYVRLLALAEALLEHHLSRSKSE